MWKDPFSSCFCLVMFKSWMTWTWNLHWDHLIFFFGIFLVINLDIIKSPQMKPFDSLIIFPEVALLYWYVAWYICHTPRLVLGENGGNRRCSKYLERIAQVNTTTMKNTLLFLKPTLIFNPQHLLILHYLKTLCLLSNTLKSTKETESSLHNSKIIIICLILNVCLDLLFQINLTFKSKSKSEKTIWSDHSNRHIKLFPGCYFIM